MNDPGAMRHDDRPGARFQMLAHLHFTGEDDRHAVPGFAEPDDRLTRFERANLAEPPDALDLGGIELRKRLIATRLRGLCVLLAACGLLAFEGEGTPRKLSSPGDDGSSRLGGTASPPSTFFGVAKTVREDAHLHDSRVTR